MKKLSVSLAVLSLVFVAFWVGCRKEEFPNSAKGKIVKTTISGQVVSEDGYPIASATVRFEDAIATTDFNGVFRLKTQKAPSDRAILTIEYEGFWKLTKTLMVDQNSHHSLKIRLLRKIYNGSFQATLGKKLDFPGGVSLNFPANAVGLNGQPYLGGVLFASKFLWPDSSTIHEEMQGALRGIRTDGSEQALATFGMLGVELTDYNGHLLDILPGMEVEISIPISEKLNTVPPQTIPLWHFDETEGLWIEEGQAEKIGKNYVGKVSHFSWWNWDVPTETANLKMRLISKTDGLPMANQLFFVSSEMPYLHGSGQTDGNGFAESLVPKNAKIELELVPDFYNQQGGCLSGILSTISIDALNEDTDLGNIIVEPLLAGLANILTVKGKLETCSGGNLSATYLLLEMAADGLNTGPLVIFPDETGFFSHETVSCIDFDFTSVNLKAWDLQNLHKMELDSTVEFSSQLDFGTIKICDPIEEFIKFNFDETEVYLTEPWVYSWFHGGTYESRISSENAGFYLGFQANSIQSGTWPAKRFRYQTMASDSSKTNIFFNIVDPGSSNSFRTGFFGGTFRDTFGILHVVQNGEYQFKQ